jgi:hypothetical protein
VGNNVGTKEDNESGLEGTRLGRTVDGLLDWMGALVSFIGVGGGVESTVGRLEGTLNDGQADGWDEGKDVGDRVGELVNFSGY